MVNMHRGCVWLLTAAAAPTPSGNEWLGRLVLIAVAVAAVGAFAVLQLRAWSRRPLSGRSRDIYDWRTLPPPLHEDDPGAGEMPFGQHESYGPLWRYGVPRGYRRDYEPGCEPARGSGYGRDSDAGDGPGDGPGPGGSPSPGPGGSPGHGPGTRRAWSVPGDVSRDWRP
jgi:hypothetical protein